MGLKKVAKAPDKKTEAKPKPVTKQTEKIVKNETKTEEKKVEAKEEVKEPVANNLPEQVEKYTLGLTGTDPIKFEFGGLVKMKGMSIQKVLNTLMRSWIIENKQK